ncbi:MAG: hypothetical protein ACPGED_09865 [Flavobacteriales bacterium]
MLVQSIETGSLFTFFEAQESWGSHWRIPKLPLSTWGSSFNLSLDGLALFFALISGVGFLMAVKKKIPLSIIEWFSLAFIGGTGLLVVLTRGGELYSLSRFVYCVPVFPFAMAVLFKEGVVPKRLFMICLAILPWFFGIHVHIQAVVGGFTLIALLMIFSYLWKANTKLTTLAALTMLFVLQAFCCSLFLQGYWLG